MMVMSVVFTETRMMTTMMNTVTGDDDHGDSGDDDGNNDGHNSHGHTVTSSRHNTVQETQCDGSV